jgi:phosphohistidine phosphatase
MWLYLIQHGEAVAKEENRERPLSTVGREEVEKVAEFAVRNCCGIAPTTSIRHSGKLRARQTAELLAATLHLRQAEAADGLQPLDDPALWGKRLREMTSDLALVGHLPHLSELASLLLCGEGAGEIVRFRMGGIVALKRENGKWALHWQIIPEIVPLVKETER